jgi:head-tail adaptor
VKPASRLASQLKHRIRIERPVADTGFRGAGKGGWTKVAVVRAGIQDVLPSRSERVSGGINVATGSSRVRMRFRDDITSAMRFVRLKNVAGAWIDDGVMQIVSGPATLGDRVGLEFMVEEYSTAGNPA